MLYTGLVCCARRKIVLMQKIWLVLIIFMVLLVLVSVRFLTLVYSFSQENIIQIIIERLLIKTSLGYTNFHSLKWKKRNMLFWSWRIFRRKKFKIQTIFVSINVHIFKFIKNIQKEDKFCHKWLVCYLLPK